MKNKTNQVIEAALKVFLKKGYKESTTAEIANEAQVAEVTLFRKFQNKQNLFNSVFQPLVSHQFNSKIFKLAELENTEEFLKALIDNRLDKISKNRNIFLMLLAESIMGNLEAEVDLPQILIQDLKKALVSHFALKSNKVDLDGLTRMLAGIFISNLVWNQDQSYHSLDTEAKENIVELYYQSLLPFIG